MVKVTILYDHNLSRLEEQINLFLEEFPEKNVRSVDFWTKAESSNFYATIVYREDIGCLRRILKESLSRK